jgi:hypothetical protein
MSRPEAQLSRTGNWWPIEFGTPASSGSGESLRYAYFPLKCRLIIERDGNLTVYDTADYQFRGAIQSSTRDPKLSFASQRGRINMDQLAVIDQSPCAVGKIVTPPLIT